MKTAEEVLKFLDKEVNPYSLSVLESYAEQKCREQREACFQNYKRHQAENIAGKVKGAWNIEGGQSHDLGKAILDTPLVTNH